MADWSQLPKELLFLIAKFVKTSSDLTRFRSVCSTWRSSVPPKSSTCFPLPTTYSLVTKRTIFLIGLPETPGRWLVKIEEDEHERIHLLDSLSNIRFKPPFYFTKILNLLNFRVFELGHEYVHQWRTTNVSYEDALQGKCISELYTKKVAFTSLNSGGDDYMLLVAKSWQLAIYKSRDKDWTMIEDLSACYDDVIQFNGKFYVADRKGRTVTVEPSSKMSLLAHSGSRSDRKFLIESGGELLLVDMFFLANLGHKSDFLAERFLLYTSNEQNRMVWFRVFKLDEERQKWDQVKCLEDRVLFLGDYSAFSVPASEFPGGKGNQIFFWEDCFISSEQNHGVSKEDRDILVFNLENGSVKPFINCLGYSKLFWPPTDWVFT